MTEIERKALALVNEVQTDCKGRSLPDEPLKAIYLWEALCRAIEQHEAFKQEVSDALEKRCFYIDDRDLGRFIIPKPDPLVECLNEVMPDVDGEGYGVEDADDLRAAIEKRGGKIVWGEG